MRHQDLQTQRAIEAKLEKKRKGIFGGPSGKKIILFVDDINMPIKDLYGSQPPIELLRQISDYSGFYDRDKVPDHKSLVDLVLMAAAAPPRGWSCGHNQTIFETFSYAMFATS